jgi:hypothetical protein
MTGMVVYHSQRIRLMIYLFILRSLFIGICDNSEVDTMIMGTLEKPHILLRFEDLLTQPLDESPEIRWIIHNGRDQT